MFKWRENGNDRSRKGKVYGCNDVLDLSTYAAVMMKWEKTFSLEQELPWTTSNKMRQGTGCFLQSYLQRFFSLRNKWYRLLNSTKH